MEEIFKKYPLSCLSALNSELVTFPIDSTKTRMQVNTTNDFRGIFMKGFKQKSLYRGLHFAIARQFIYSGSRMATYEICKKQLKVDTIIGKSLSALYAGMFAQVLATPLDLYKIRKITGNTKKVENIYQGIVPIVMRSSVNTLGYLASYDIAKENIIKMRGKEDYLTYSLSSFVSGLSSSILCTPFDNLKSNAMNSSKKVKIIPFFKKVYKQNGIKGVYTGFLGNWGRSAPWHFVFWNSFEFYAKLFSLDSI